MSKNKFSIPKLSLNQNKYYLLRFRVHKELFTYFNKPYISKSLETKNKKQAEQKAHIIYLRYLEILYAEKSLIISSELIKEKVDDFIEHTIKQSTKVKKVISRDNETYGTAVEKYVIWFENKDVTNRTKRNNIDLIVDIFLPLVGKNNTITTDVIDIIDIKNKLKNFPNRNFKEYKDLSVKELLKVKVPLDKRIADSQLLKCIKIIKAFFKFCYRNKFIDFDPSEGVSVAVDKTFKRRESFTKEEIVNLIDVVLAIKTDIKYIYLIYIFTGMRREEAFKATMKLSEDNIWYFDLTANNGFTLKTNSSFRRIPVHDKLLEYGLTPELYERSKTVTSVMETGRQFNVLYKTQVTDSKRKTLHSLRHTVNNLLKIERVDTLAREELLGHEHTGTNNTVYSEDYSLRILKVEINKLNYFGVSVKIAKD